MQNKTHLHEPQIKPGSLKRLPGLIFLDLINLQIKEDANVRKDTIFKSV